MQNMQKNLSYLCKLFQRFPGTISLPFNKFLGNLVSFVEIQYLLAKTRSEEVDLPNINFAFLGGENTVAINMIVRHVKQQLVEVRF